MLDEDEKTFVVALLFAGFLWVIIMLTLVFATGSTFGQRCTNMGYTDTAHSKCVTSLSKGKTVDAIAE